MGLESDVDDYREVVRGLRMLARLTPVSLAADRPALVRYLRTGQRPDLTWKLAPNDDGVSLRLRNLADRMSPEAIDYATELQTLAAGLALAGTAPGEYQEWVGERYGRISDNLRAYAGSEVADTALPPPIQDLSAVEFANASMVVLRLAAMPDWTVESRPAMAARVMVSGHTIIVREAATFSTGEFVRLMVHEVGTHAFRRANADDQTHLLLRHTPFSDAWTEEGLAVWNERHAGVSSREVERVYAARVLAIGRALEAGITDVLDELRDHLEPELAVDVAIRAKRGFSDPHLPGAFTKDLAYLGGYLDIARTVDLDPATSRILMAAKWPLSRLDALQSFRASGILVEPARLPESVAAIARDALNHVST